MNKILQQDPPIINGEYSPFLKRLTLDLLTKDPEKRLSIQSLFQKKEVQLEIEKIRSKYKFDEKPSKISFQEYLKKLETEDTLQPINNSNNILKDLENDRTLTKKNSSKNSTLKSNENIENNNQVAVIPGKCLQKPPRQFRGFNEIINHINNNNNNNNNNHNNQDNQEIEVSKTRSNSLNNKEDPENGLKEVNININMETIIKNKDYKNGKSIINNKEETVNNFANFIKREANNNINNRTQNLHKNEPVVKTHTRRCSLNTKPENPSFFFKNQLYNTLENQEYIKKMSYEFLKKILDINAPLAARRKILLKEFLNKKLGKKVCEDVQKVIEKQPSANREINSKILEIIGKENENYILIFNYLFNPECLYPIKKTKN